MPSLLPFVFQFSAPLNWDKEKRENPHSVFPPLKRERRALKNSNEPYAPPPPPKKTSNASQIRPNLLSSLKLQQSTFLRPCFFLDIYHGEGPRMEWKGRREIFLRKSWEKGGERHLFFPFFFRPFPPPAKSALETPLSAHIPNSLQKKSEL